MSTADGNVIGTTKIVDHGANSDRYNIVILGDGYQGAELATAPVLVLLDEGVVVGAGWLPAASCQAHCAQWSAVSGGAASR